MNPAIGTPSQAEQNCVKRACTPTAEVKPFIPIWLGLMLLIAYGPALWQMTGVWFNDSLNMEHGVLVPIIAGYIVWLKRDAFQNAVTAPAGWGILLVIWAAVQAVLTNAMQGLWATDLAFVIALFGCLVAVYGIKKVRVLAYPLLMLLFMLPPPAYFYERVTIQLQLLASRLGEVSLEAMGYSVLREGNILELVGERLAVAEACSGMRSLTSLTFLCLTYCYFSVRGNRLRAVMLATVVPIAIICNAGRIVATGVVGQYNRRLAHGMLHSAFGYVGLAIGFIFIVLLHHGLNAALFNKHRGLRPDGA